MIKLTVLIVVLTALAAPAFAQWPYYPPDYNQINRERREEWRREHHWKMREHWREHHEFCEHNPRAWECR